MLELLLGGKKKSTGFVRGNEELGFMGEVKSADFITGSALASAVGLTKGTTMYDGGGWLKFSYKGVIIYIAKLALRYNLTWADLYAAGIVYGNDGYGRNPSGYPAVLQNKKVKIGENTYKVRLLKSAATDPSPYPPSGEEVMNLLLRVMTRGAWPLYTSSQLGLTGSSNGSWTMVQETWNGNNYLNRLAFYASGTYDPGWAAFQVAGSDPGLGWRPVLELIPPA